jgi:hypothetical protein
MTSGSFNKQRKAQRVQAAMNSPLRLHGERLLRSSNESSFDGATAAADLSGAPASFQALSGAIQVSPAILFIVE